MNHNWKDSYFDYLTKRLDSGESSNIAVLETIKIIKKKLKKKELIKVLDVGCFSGAMLNRILNGLSKSERDQVEAVGLDCDKVVMEKGSNKYQDIIYIYSQIENNIPLIKQFDIVLISNVLHEIAPKDGVLSRIKKIKNVFSDITNLVKEKGNIIVLDGCKPDNNSLITINFQNKKDQDLFIEFSKKYKALKIKCNISKDGITTNEISLTAFLTKARYLNEDYWESESKQLYQYFSEKDFLTMFKKNNLKVTKNEPQYFTEETLKSMFKNIKPNIQKPTKNILLIAEKSTSAN